MEMIDYNKDTGELFWNHMANKRVRNKPANTIDRQGYVVVRLDGKYCLGHRIAWFKHYGVWPEGQIDHINGIKHDNRISNLRVATHSQNCWNKPKQSNNTSGFKGVTFHKTTCKYHARICANKKSISLGYYQTAEEASNAYVKAAGELHGQFAQS